MSSVPRPRILFFSQWFEPEPTYKGLSFVRDLMERGFDVDVLSGFPNFPFGKLFAGYRMRPIMRETMSGVRVTRVPLYPSHDANGARRSLNYLSFFVSATLYLLFRRRRYDAIYVYHPPITVGLAAAVAGLIRRTPFVIEIQDLWPDGVAASGMADGRVVRLLGVACRFVYRRAARIVAQSRGMATRIVERGGDAARVTAVYNWAEESDTIAAGITDLAPFGFADHFTFLYAGNMGPHQALASVVEAAHIAAAEEPRIRLVLVGGGIAMNALNRLAKTGRDVVRVLPGVARSQVADLMTAADVLLVHLSDLPMYAVTIPSKTQFYLAVGKPVLAGLEGEAAELVRAADAGVVVPPENTAAMARAMVALARAHPTDLAAMGARGRDYYRANLSLRAGMDRIVAVIEDAICNHRVRS